DRAGDPQRDRPDRPAALAVGRGAGMACLALRGRGGARPGAAGNAGVGGDGIPVQHAPGVLFDVLGRVDAAAGGAVRGQPAGAAGGGGGWGGAVGAGADERLIRGCRFGSRAVPSRAPALFGRRGTGPNSLRSNKGRSSAPPSCDAWLALRLEDQRQRATATVVA